MSEKTKTFEENMQHLEKIVQTLESGDVALEDAIKQFQKGMALSKELQKTLDKAKESLMTVIEDDGTETVEK